MDIVKPKPKPTQPKSSDPQSSPQSASSTPPATASTPPTTSPPSEPPAGQPPQKKGKGWKIALGIGGGCLILIIIGAVIGFFLVPRGVQKAGQELNQFNEEFASELSNLEAEINEMNAEDFGDYTSEEFAEDFNVDVEVDSSKNVLSGGVGDTLQNELLTATINSVEFLPKIGSSTPRDSSDQFLKLNLTLENLSDASLSIIASSFYLNDDQDYEYYPANVSNKDLQNTLELRVIQAGQEESGNLAFEVPKNVGQLTLNYDDGTNSVLVFELGRPATAPANQ